MATTTNFGWTTPDDTGLVKDGASAIRTLGSAIDTSLYKLKGGTTGQFLSKATATDMDFTWASAMTNPLTTTGDTIYSSSGTTAARLAIGTTGQVLTVSGGVPSWATPSGSLTLLSTTTLTGSSTTISSISQSYKNLLFYLDNWTLDANVKLDVRIDSNSGAGIYQINRMGVTAYAFSSTTELRPNSDNNAATGAQNNQFVAIIYDYASTTLYKNFEFNGFYMNSTPTKNNESGFGSFTSTSGVDSLVIRSSNGTANIGGTCRIYGVN